MSETGPKFTIFGKLVVLLIIGACGYGAYVMLKAPVAGTAGVQRDAAPGGTAPVSSKVTAEIGVAYGTEKERWLKWALEQFQNSQAGAAIKVNLIPMGSLEGAQAILGGDKRIDLWSPASSLYEDTFQEEWKLKNNNAPFTRKELLALSPMVFVSWADRYAAFTAKYKECSFTNIGQALHEPGGWNAIAGNPDWGLFKFGHSNPQESNS